jgi:LysM repeat protein
MSTKSKYILKNKIRFIVLITIVIFLVIILSYTIDVFANSKNQYEVIMVIPGDTLWEIAAKNNKNGDIRKYIYKMKEINNLDDSLIYPGMSIKLP